MPKEASKTIYLTHTKDKGRGVFAGKSFKAGEVIERAPVIVIPGEQWKHIKKTIIFNYVFCWEENTDDTALALGYGSFYNHSYSPNADCDNDLDEQEIIFKAIRNIERGEEITINYNGLGDKSPLWFEVAS
ncbi:MAG TPA: SET domain-containing protein [Blastocatellia bacterium]|nr:SET domain-containing protein [Blastocatellia bacterium]